MSWEQSVQQSIVAAAKSDYNRAEKCLKDALQCAKEKFSRTDSRLALTLSCLAHTYFNKRDFSRAELLFEQSLKLHRASGCFNDRCVVMDLLCLVEIKRHSTKRADACAWIEETVAGLRERNGAPHETLTQAIDHFDSLLAMMQRQLAAEPKPPVAQIEQPAGTVSGGADEAPSTPVADDAPIPSIDSLTQVWQQQLNKGLGALRDEDEEREALVSAYLNLESAFRLARTIFKPGDVNMINTLRGLADASARLRMYSQAEGLYREAIELAESAGHKASASVSALRINLALVYAESDQLKAAKAILDAEEVPDGITTSSLAALNKRVERAFRMIRTFEATEDLLKQAHAAEEADDIDKASRLVNTALSQLKQSFSPNHPLQARLLRYRAELLNKLGNEEQAAEIMQRAERIERANETQTSEWEHVTQELPRPVLLETMLSTTVS